jgi:hypothetical protein
MSQPYKGELLIGPCPICGREARTDEEGAAMSLYDDEGWEVVLPAHEACLQTLPGGTLQWVDEKTGDRTPMEKPGQSGPMN